MLEDLRMEETPAVDLARPAPPHEGAGGGLPPPRGNTGARPSLFYCPSGVQCFVFVDLCDICNIDMRNCLANSGLLEPFGVILEGLEPS